MKKFGKLAFCAALVGFALSASAAITTDCEYTTVEPGVSLSQGEAVTNVVDTSKAIGVATFVVPYQLADGGQLDIEFAGAITNGAPFVSCPTNAATLLASYSVTNGTIFTVAYPASSVPGRWMRVIIKATTGASRASAVFAAWKME